MPAQFDVDALAAEADAMEALVNQEVMARISTPPPPSRRTSRRRAGKRKTPFAEEENGHWERWPISRPEITTSLAALSTPSPPSAPPA